jgi:hypothetical protein
MAAPPSTPQPSSLTISFLFDDDVPAGTDTILAVLASRPIKRPVEAAREDASVEDLDDAA